MVVLNSVVNHLKQIMVCLYLILFTMYWRHLVFYRRFDASWNISHNINKKNNARQKSKTTLYLIYPIYITKVLNLLANNKLLIYLKVYDRYFRVGVWWMTIWLYLFMKPTMFSFIVRLWEFGNLKLFLRRRRLVTTFFFRAKFSSPDRLLIDGVSNVYFLHNKY